MLYVDRIENGIAVCEDSQGVRVCLGREMYVGELHDGDVLVKYRGKYRVSRRLTEKRREELAALQNRLFVRK